MNQISCNLCWQILNGIVLCTASLLRFDINISRILLSQHLATKNFWCHIGNGIFCNNVEDAIKIFNIDIVAPLDPLVDLFDAIMDDGAVGDKLLLTCDGEFCMDTFRRVEEQCIVAANCTNATIMHCPHHSSWRQICDDDDGFSYKFL